MLAMMRRPVDPTADFPLWRRSPRPAQTAFWRCQRLGPLRDISVADKPLMSHPSCLQLYRANYSRAQLRC